MSFSTRNTFKLSRYDAVCLDFDNTLVQYNLTNLFQIHYKYLTTYLIEKKGYKNLQTVMNENDIDFIRKGLFMDFDRGNILNISGKGTILSASHGTKMLNKYDIVNFYGSEMRWPPLDLLIKDKLAINRNIPTADTYSFLDFTDIPAILVYAKLVDLVDEQNVKDYRPVWSHVIDAVIDMYRMDSEFIKTFHDNVSNYVYKCNKEMIGWLQILKENCRLMLISSAIPQTLNHLAKYCLGPNWESMFHTIIDTAGKPNFFIGKNSFKDRNDQEIVLKTTNGYYRNGNWQDLHNVLNKELGRPTKCVYIGDNLIHDIYAPSLASSLDSVSIVEEVQAEGYFTGHHPHSPYIRSNFWGSCFLYDGIATLMGDIVMKHSKLCVPLLSYLAKKPLDYNHTPFWVSQFTNQNNIISDNFKNDL